MSKIERNSDKYFYPVRDANDSKKINLVEISKEVYESLYPEIWRTRKRMQKRGCCICAKVHYWKCDGNCELCEYNTAPGTIPTDCGSLDSPVRRKYTPDSEADGLTLADTLPYISAEMSEILEDIELLDALHKELDGLSPECRELCRVVEMGLTERESARLLNIPKNTFRYRWQKVREQLFKHLREYV